MKSESTLDFDKAIVHNEMNVCLKLTHPQTIQNVDEFVSYSEQVWREIKHYINYSPDPMQWMGAVRTRVQTTDRKLHDNT